MTFHETTIGPCRLILADCVDVLFSGVHADVMITDPPFGVAFNGKRRRAAADAQVTTGGYDDEETESAAIVTQAILWSQKSCRSAAVFVSNRLVGQVPIPTSVGGIFSPSSVVMDRWGFVTHHMLYFYGRDPFRIGRIGGSQPNSVSIQTKAVRTSHPCEKPLPWMKWLVERASKNDDVVLDPFMGSATTAVACIASGRKFVGVEVNHDYFKLACERVENAWRLERSKLPLENIATLRQAELFAERKAE